MTTKTAHFSALIGLLAMFGGLGVAEAQNPRAAVGERIAAFCVARSGQKVGNGECWTLADDAMRAAGARRPGRDLRVWGRQVNPAKEPVRPGDVVEFRNARFSDGTHAGRHTAVVVRGGSGGNIALAEQNWGKKTVRLRELDLRGRLSGSVIIFRPG